MIVCIDSTFGCLNPRIVGRSVVIGGGKWILTGSVFVLKFIYII